MGSRLERLFERFRRKGEAAALGAVFDEVAPEIYRVAIHLAPDLHAAEDLVQSTFLAAIEARERWDRARPLVPWLLGILARKATYAQRAGARTPEAERLEPRSASEPSNESQAAELRALLESSLGKISSPYREVLVAHLFDEKSAPEIARDLGRAPGTVRVQIHRGLELLRKELPGGLVTTGIAIVLSPRGLAVVRGAVMRSARAAVGPAVGVTAGATSPVLIGSLVMNMKILALGAGAAVCIAWLGLLARPRPALETSTRTEALDGARTSLVIDDGAPSGPSSHASERTRALSGGTSEMPHPDKETAPTAIAGEPGVCGQLLLPGGLPASGAFVALVRSIDGVPDGEPVDQETSTSDGTFCLHARSGTYFLVARAEGLCPWAQALQLEDAVLRLDPTTLSAGVHIRGHARILGQPAPTQCGISLLCLAEGKSIGHTALLWSKGAWLTRSRSAKTDAEGRFVFEGLDARTYRITLESTPLARVLHASREVDAPSDQADLDVDLARVLVHVRSAGEPVEAGVYLIEYSQSRPSNLASAIKELPTRGSSWGVGSKSDAEFLVPPGAAYRVEATREGFVTAAADIAPASSGEVIERTLVLKRTRDLGELWIDIVSPDGRKIEQAGLALFAARPAAKESDSHPTIRPGRAGPDGRSPDVVRDERSVDNCFRLRDIPANAYRVLVQPDSTWMRGEGYWYHEPAEVDVTPGGTARARVDLRLGGRLRLSCANRRGAWLPARCEVYDGFGTKLPVTFFRWDEKRNSSWGGRSALNASAPNGANDVYPNLPPGNYQVRFSHDGYVGVTRMATVEAGRTTEVEAILEDG